TGDNQYAVSVRSVTAGEAHGAFTPPLSTIELENFVLRMGVRRNVRRLKSAEWRAAREFGQKLFRAVFSDEVRDCFVSAHHAALRQDKGLRIKLTLNAPALADYPWEFLHDPTTDRFLCLFEKTPLIRYVELTDPIASLAITPPLRILVVAASPRGYEPLDIP